MRVPSYDIVMMAKVKMIKPLQGTYPAGALSLKLICEAYHYFVKCARVELKYAEKTKKTVRLSRLS